MLLLLNEGSLNVTTFRYCCLGFFLAWKPLGIYFLKIQDAVTSTFYVLVNTYLLNFRLQTIISFSWDKYSLLIFHAVLHQQLNYFKISKMVQHNHRSLMISTNDSSYKWSLLAQKFFIILTTFLQFFNRSKTSKILQKMTSKIIKSKKVLITLSCYFLIIQKTQN